MDHTPNAVALTVRETLFEVGPDAIPLREFRRLYDEALGTMLDEWKESATVEFGPAGMSVYYDRPVTAEEIEIRERQGPG